jgi:hypothetical protein
MIEPRCVSQPVFTDDLQIKVQGGTRLAPAKVIEVWPCIAHLLSFFFPKHGKVVNTVLV